MPSVEDDFLLEPEPIDGLVASYYRAKLEALKEEARKERGGKKYTPEEVMQLIMRNKDD